MPIETKSTKIRGKTYSITVLDADKGVAMVGRLMRFIVGPLLIAAIAEKQNDADTRAKALFQFLSNMAEPEFVALVKEILEESRHEGTVIQFAGHWAANYGELFELWFFAVKENFQSFLDGSIAPGLVNMAKKEFSDRLPKTG